MNCMEAYTRDAEIELGKLPTAAPVDDKPGVTRFQTRQVNPLLTSPKKPVRSPFSFLD